MAIAHFDSKSFDEAIASGTTLVDFWATWCGPCRMQAPILDAFESEMGTVVKVGKVDVDEQPEIAARYNIFSIPTLIAFKDGAEIARNVGVTDLDGLKRLIQA
jgi:thioredoxin 1